MEFKVHIRAHLSDNQNRIVIHRIIGPIECDVCEMLAVARGDGNGDAVTAINNPVGRLGNLSVTNDLRGQFVMYLGIEDGKGAVLVKVFKVHKKGVADLPSISETV